MSIFESVKCGWCEGAEHHEGGRRACCEPREQVLSRLWEGAKQEEKVGRMFWKGNNLCEGPELREKVESLKMSW